jgi:hypothetical protein
MGKAYEAQQRVEAQRKVLRDAKRRGDEALIWEEARRLQRRESELQSIINGRGHAA